MAKKKHKGMKPKREKRTPMILVDHQRKSGKKGRKG